ncbi:MAG: GTP-binding protein, partial [Candidatus Woesearchaeota archaeon]
MPDYLEKIKELEDELKKTKYNKRTQFHIGLVKAKIAKLKEKELSRGRGGAPKEGYAVKKSGDATVILVGYPSVGKSTLLNVLTDAHSDVGAYDFTTLTVVPGLLEHNHAKIQILDVPGIVRGAATGRGRGKEVLAVMRNADLVLIVVDVNHPEHLEILKNEIYDTGLRLNEKKPDVKIVRTPRGGLKIGTTVRLTKIDKRTIEGVCREMGINNAELTIREDITSDQLIDVIEANKKYVPSIVVINKIDTVSSVRLMEIEKEIKPDISISAEKGIGIRELKDVIFNSLNFIRIFCKQQGKKADLDVPLIMTSPCSV